jgi:hypothetical protein
MDHKESITKFKLALLPLLKYLSNQCKVSITNSVQDITEAFDFLELQNNILLQTIDHQDSDIMGLKEEIDTLEAEANKEDDYSEIVKILDECYKFGYDPDRLERLNDAYRILCLNTVGVTP